MLDSPSAKEINSKFIIAALPRTEMLFPLIATTDEKLERTPKLAAMEFGDVFMRNWLLRRSTRLLVSCQPPWQPRPWRKLEVL